VRDPRIAPKGWSTNERDRRSLKVENWHGDWTRRWRDRAEFNPELRRVEDSDYNEHYVDVGAPIEAELDYGPRSDEIGGYRLGGTERLPVPTGGEKLRGAIVAAGVGDALADFRSAAGPSEHTWRSGGAIGVEEKLVDYLPPDRMGWTWVTQLMGFAAEGMVRALGARRTGHPVDPVSTVQHGYQRWLHYMRKEVGKPGEWRKYGGPYAKDAGERDQPDGMVADVIDFVTDQRPDPAIIEALLGFAATGIRSTRDDPHSTARGADVLVRAALAAVWSEDLLDTFDLGVAVAALTHPHPDDCLAAGTLAVILHQQIRDQPFMDCMVVAWGVLVRHPGHEKTRKMMDAAVELVRDEWTPTQTDNLRRHFPEGGADGAEALGIALYCAMVSDYLREALILALNYADHRNEVAAVAGMLIGAEYGIQSVPKVFRDPVVGIDALDELAQELATELRDVLSQGEWQRRYPPT